MNVLYTPPELPEISMPAIVAPNDFQLVSKTYQLWLHRTIEQKSKPESVEEFIQLVRDLDAFQNIPIHHRMGAMTKSQCIDFLRFHLRAKELRKSIGNDFLPMMELMADAHFFFAETADFVLRYVRLHPPEGGLPPVFYKALDQKLGIKTLKGVEKDFRFAFDLYAMWLSHIYEIMEEAPRDDLGRSQNISLETVTGRLALTLSRLLLIQLTNWLESHTDLQFNVASGLHILPQLALYPEARLALKGWHKEIDLVQNAIEILFQFETGFNDKRTIVIVFQNLAIFAITVGAYEWAINALNIAKQVADANDLSYIQRNIHLAIDLQQACQIH